MSISFTNYGEKVEKLEKKIKKYEEKLKKIIDTDVESICLEDLSEKDRKLHERYTEVIEKLTRQKEDYQEKAINMAEEGKTPLTNRQKVIIIAAGIALIGALGGYGTYYCYNNASNDDTESLDQSQADDALQNNDRQNSIDDFVDFEGSKIEPDYVAPSQDDDILQTNDGQDSSMSDSEETMSDTDYDFDLDSLKNLLMKYASKNKGNSNDKTNTTGEEPQLPVESESLYGTDFNDINNEEQVYARAKEIKELYDRFAPQYGVDIEYAAEMLKYINGGVVSETSREAVLDVVHTFDVLVNNEYLYAKEMRNKGKTGREESYDTIDYGMFFLDNSKAQKLAIKITSFINPIIENPLGDTSEYEKGFTELLMNSWYNQGYQEISTYALGVSGMSTIIDKLFLSTADVVRANQDDKFDIIVHDPFRDKDVTLRQMIDEINEANCEIEMTYDDGTSGMQYVNKLTYDMEGMLMEAVYNKQTYEDNFGKGLK